MSSNHELARAAAESCKAYKVDDWATVIRDTYAEPMADLEKLRAIMNRVEVTPLDYCPSCLVMDGKHAKNCDRKPDEVAT